MYCHREPLRDALYCWLQCKISHAQVCVPQCPYFGCVRQCPHSYLPVSARPSYRCTCIPSVLLQRTGIISFSEWLCLPPVRDESTFNCVGGHGLARGNVAFPYTPCAWCKRNISKGQKVLECRACHCHACLDCVTKHLVKPYGASAPRISCKRDHRLVWRQTNGPFPTMCNVCGDLTAARAVIFGCRFVPNPPPLSGMKRKSL